MGMAKTAELGQNNAEALEYYNRALEIDPTLVDAWIGKGSAAAWQSNLRTIRLPEALIAFNHAIANAPVDDKAAVAARVVAQVNTIVVALYKIARDHMIEYVSLDNSWTDYLSQVAQLLDSLEEVRKWEPANITTLENIIHLCKDNIEGYSYRDQYNNNWPSLHSITPEYEKLLRSRMDDAAEAIRGLDPEYQAPIVQKKESAACFVVTATLGDSNHPDVVFLRRFRDQYMRRSRKGRAFIACYYRIGPIAAAVIERSSVLKRVAFRLVVQPAVNFAERRLPRR